MKYNFSTNLVVPFLKLSSTVGLVAGLSINTIYPVLGLNTTSKTQLISQSGKKVEITLVSYAVTKGAYEKIIPQFVAKWKREKGQDVIIRESYGGSGSQTRAVIDGLPADVVALALALDTKKIEKAGLIQPGWEKEAPNNSIVTRSVVALETRPRNPKKIKNWADLAKPGIKIITANPKTSGGARWNFLALWGAITKNGGNETQAQNFVTQVFRNVAVLPKDARESSDVFYKKGQGDVLLNYENEVILAAQQGKTDVSYEVPSINISIDAPVAVVDKNVDKHGNRQVAEAFVKFLFTPEAQREFAKVGFRPVNSTVAKEVQNKFPKISRLYTVDNLGGWNAVQKKFFDDGAIFDKIQGAKR
ncbi:sulfate ABC transporter substrate-binding protein [Anabaena cylindrica FACHB-243]|uniref:Sulfate ABC transporter, periplasmic sulfate-binding protein n=1 Tax=Anabaena cylindrica (strain ATCC 27899 / PCC 7122) TaxID=272123 RepID=K9ZBD2_ANACC|nr:MULTISPECIES: sulfate ABC transporter substrate-binding protein [Anabaena]AFZ55680.1 sulfate ABC transporter, periplasmic sulfate-binding protein [Anabaena cylindrica PCC 7122]MBD2420312.1 sulfate ABC transporter substrate-binding protein [Anabaena cylindrica FACHB-243]MBY5282073.1 sulfate ABC transporter substrate-binding protein [Anabaena sp. CCAP 1446/1C]MBY5309629.1 sulfate ABC transporter substrate-binding protein [Anabaena sp. CCAP 1446/1C]MCM2406029.1 sulfate ABC transporter substrat